MRLLNTKTLLLESFDGRQVPPYAILSHTWEEDEVLFEDVFAGQSRQVIPTEKQGYTKIKYSCDHAQRDELEYIWIDTCCINKSSSAELSEAINSMFNWYERATRCYVYLFDLNRPNQPDITFEESRWFGRGWTLQELLAPVHVEFYDNQWTPLGDKGTGSRENSDDPPDSEWEDEFDGFEAILNLDTAQPKDYEGNLAYRIESITGIPIEVLTLKQRPISRLLSRFSAAQRLSWAANRQTARLEDRAYSLLGLFNVKMPLLYGEGNEAFLRLQQQIIDRYNDQTVLAFKSGKLTYWELHSPLASDPAVFANSNIIHVPKSQRSVPKTAQEPFSYSWRHIDLQVYLCSSLGNGQKYALGILDCGYSDDPLSRPALVLRRLDGPGCAYRRIEHSTLFRITARHLLNSGLIQLDLPWIREGLEETKVKFDVNKAPLTSIKLMLGSSVALDYGPLYVITAPAQILLGEDFILHFAWPRPPETTSASRNAGEKSSDAVGSLWLSATSDYDPDRADLKSIRDLLGHEVLLNGLACIEWTGLDSDDTAHDAGNSEEGSEMYFVLWGLGRMHLHSIHQDRVNHGQLHSESVWCYVVRWDDVLDPSLAPLAHDILQLDLSSILTRIQGTLLLSRHDLQDKCSLTRPHQGPGLSVTAQISCLDFFGQDTLQLRVGSSLNDQSNYF